MIKKILNELITGTSTEEEVTSDILKIIYTVAFIALLIGVFIGYNINF